MDSDGGGAGDQAEWKGGEKGFLLPTVPEQSAENPILHTPSRTSLPG